MLGCLAQVNGLRQPLRIFQVRGGSSRGLGSCVDADTLWDRLLVKIGFESVLKLLLTLLEVSLPVLKSDLFRALAIDLAFSLLEERLHDFDLLFHLAFQGLFNRVFRL